MKRMTLLTLVGLGALLVVGSLAGAAPLGDFAELQRERGQRPVPDRVGRRRQSLVLRPGRAEGDRSHDAERRDHLVCSAGDGCSAPGQSRLRRQPLVHRHEPDRTGDRPRERGRDDQRLPAARGELPERARGRRGRQSLVHRQGEDPGPSTPAGIGRITVDGTISKYTVGLLPGSQPNGISPAADGWVWFTDQGTTKAIGRVKDERPARRDDRGVHRGARRDEQPGGDHHGEGRHALVHRSA